MSISPLRTAIWPPQLTSPPTLVARANGLKLYETESDDYRSRSVSHFDGGHDEGQDGRHGVCLSLAALLAACGSGSSGAASSAPSLSKTQTVQEQTVAYCRALGPILRADRALWLKITRVQREVGASKAFSMAARINDRIWRSRHRSYRARWSDRGAAPHLRRPV